ncbi:MAG: hypothetical protein PHS74_13445 [Lachnospiraceae bacterium]|nr:hypothetical protein [Lachnospiraceae bacterium]
MRKVSAFTIVTCILVGIICFCITGTVFSQEKSQSKVQKAYREQMEKDYVQEVRELLENEDMSNSGITMTKVIYPDGQMQYELTIHNRKIDKMSEHGKQQLQGKLQKLSFPDTESMVQHQFLEL